MVDIYWGDDASSPNYIAPKCVIGLRYRLSFISSPSENCHLVEEVPSRKMTLNSGASKQLYFLGSKNYLKGSHHIGCSLSHFDPWIFVLGAECLSKKSGLQTVKEITFNKNVGHLVQECLNVEYSEPQIEGDIKRGRFRVQTNGGHNYTTHKDDFEKIINHVALNQRSQF